MPQPPKIHQPEYGDVKQLETARKSLTPTPQLPQGPVGGVAIPTEQDDMLRQAIQAQSDAEECIRIAAAHPNDPDLQTLAMAALQRFYQLREAARGGTPFLE